MKLERKKKKDAKLQKGTFSWCKLKRQSYLNKDNLDIFPE